MRSCLISLDWKSNIGPSVRKKGEIETFLYQQNTPALHFFTSYFIINTNALQFVDRQRNDNKKHFFFFLPF